MLVHLRLKAAGEGPSLQEPENSLAPQYLGRIIRQLRAACDFGDLQSLIATHAPTLLRRVDPPLDPFLAAEALHNEGIRRRAMCTWCA
jgi:putative ATP-dependent endonuclease of OLD family